MMTRSTIFISTIILAGILLPSIAGDNPCRYELPSKGVIDLTSVGNKDGTAAFLDVTPTPVSGWKYSYNPCKPFSESTFCQKVAACQVGSMESFPIGTQESAQWLPPAGLGGSPSIKYTAGPKTLTVTIKCSTNRTTIFEALGEGTTNNYTFRLTHKCGCWDECKSSGPTGGGGLSGGTVFIIILLVLVVVYLFGFTAYNRFRLNESGIALIPHRTFWIALPGYAKDGVFYIYHRATGKGGGGGGSSSSGAVYQSI